MVTHPESDANLLVEMSGLTPRLRGDGYPGMVWTKSVTYLSGLTPRLRGDGYPNDLIVVKSSKIVRTYAPFERGWLPIKAKFPLVDL